MRCPSAVIAVALALAAAACSGESESEREERAMRAAVPVRLQVDGTVQLSDADRAAAGLTVVVAAEGELPRTELRFGRVRVRTQEEALVVAPAAGRVVAPPAVQLGATVASGDPIVEVVPVLAAADRISLGMQRAQLEGQIRGAVEELATRESEAVRARSLAGASVSVERVQQVELAVATTRARLDALRRAGAQQTVVQSATRSVLRAPAAGIVASLTPVVGELVQAGDVLARILRPGPRWIDVSVPPDEPTGSGYEVAAAHGWRSARLIARGAIVEDDGNRHDRLEVTPDELTPWIPGTTLAVRVAREQVRGVVLPDAAVVPGVGLDVVYVETTPGRFAPRRVQIVARLGGQVRIATGVQVGERVVTQGAMALRGESLRGALRHVE